MLLFSNFFLGELRLENLTVIISRYNVHVGYIVLRPKIQINDGLSVQYQFFRID